MKKKFWVGLAIGVLMCGFMISISYADLIDINNYGFEQPVLPDNYGTSETIGWDHISGGAQISNPPSDPPGVSYFYSAIPEGQNILTVFKTTYGGVEYNGMVAGRSLIN